mmetsp:Transcript_32863/g.42009  ORF Transcript_32863/g.42009 Transcript_32863/m.42009 type:complete len:139 (-) Transcript_32863:775-1191(-)
MLPLLDEFTEPTLPRRPPLAELAKTVVELGTFCSESTLIFSVTHLLSFTTRSPPSDSMRPGVPPGVPMELRLGVPMEPRLELRLPGLIRGVLSLEDVLPNLPLAARALLTKRTAVELERRLMLGRRKFPSDILFPIRL